MHDSTINDAHKSGSIKTIELKPGITFTANGEKYTVTDSFAIGRLSFVSLLEEELAMFADRESCHKVMLDAMALMNDMKHGDAYAIMYNKVHSDRENAKTIHYTLRTCAAFINYEGEDLRKLTEQDIQRKINDWSEEGLDVRPFIAFAMSAYSEYFQSFKKDILNTLTEARSIKQAMLQETDIKSLTGEENLGGSES